MPGRNSDDDVHRRLAPADGEVTWSLQALRDQLRTVRRLQQAVSRSRSIRRIRRLCATLMAVAAAIVAVWTDLTWGSLAFIGPDIICVVAFLAAAVWRSIASDPYNYNHDDVDRVASPLPELESRYSSIILNQSESRLRPLAELETDLALEEHILRRAREENYPSVTARRRRYRDDIEGLVSQFQRESRQYRRVHNGLQSLIMVGSAVTTTVSALDIEGLTWQHIATIAISLSITLASAFTGYYKYRERTFFLQQTADAIEEQLNAFEYGVGDYSGYDDDQAQALARLTNSVESLRNEQRRRQQQLDQPADQTGPTNAES